MSRIRSIHPGFWTDEKFAALSDSATLLYIGLLTECDDQGMFEWKPLQIRMRLRPAKDGSVDRLLEELEQADAIRRFPIGGRLYGAVRNFCKYQKPKFPKFVHPTSSEIANYVSSKSLATPDDATSTQSPTVETPVEHEPIPRNAEQAAQRERRREEGEKEGVLEQERNQVSENQKAANGAALSEMVAGLVKRSVRKPNGSAYLWLKQDDTRVPQAVEWWRKHYGSDPPLRTMDSGKQGYHVPWAAVNR